MWKHVDSRLDELLLRLEENIMSSIADLQALVQAQGTLLTAVLAELAALQQQVNGSPSTTVLSTADQASVDAMVEAVTAQNAELTAAEPTPAPAPAAAAQVEEPAAEAAPEAETPTEDASEPAEEPTPEPAS